MSKCRTRSTSNMLVITNVKGAVETPRIKEEVLDNDPLEFGYELWWLGDQGEILFKACPLSD